MALCCSAPCPGTGPAADGSASGRAPVHPHSSISDGGTHKGIPTLFYMLYSTRLHSTALSLSDRWGDERVNTTALTCSQTKTFKSRYLNCTCTQPPSSTYVADFSSPLASRGDGHLSHKARYKLMYLKTNY